MPTKGKRKRAKIRVEIDCPLSPGYAREADVLATLWDTVEWLKRYQDKAARPEGGWNGVTTSIPSAQFAGNPKAGSVKVGWEVY